MSNKYLTKTANPSKPGWGTMAWNWLSTMGTISDDRANAVISRERDPERQRRILEGISNASKGYWASFDEYMNNEPYRNALIEASTGDSLAGKLDAAVLRTAHRVGPETLMTAKHGLTAASDATIGRVLGKQLDPNAWSKFLQHAPESIEGITDVWGMYAGGGLAKAALKTVLSNSGKAMTRDGMANALKFNTSNLSKPSFLSAAKSTAKDVGSAINFVGDGYFVTDALKDAKDVVKGYQAVKNEEYNKLRDLAPKYKSVRDYRILEATKENEDLQRANTPWYSKAYEWVKENPKTSLAIGGGALAGGLLLAYLLRRNKKQNRKN